MTARRLTNKALDETAAKVTTTSQLSDNIITAAKLADDVRNFKITSATAVEGQTQFSADADPGYDAGLMVFVNGVYQKTGVNYTRVGALVTFTSGLSAGDDVDIIRTALVSQVIEPADGSVTYAKLAADTKNVIVDKFVGDGSTVDFTLTETPYNENGILVFIDGIWQSPGVNFSVSTNVLTLGSAPDTDADIVVTHFTYRIGEYSWTPTDNSIGTSQLIDDSITTSKLTNGVVTEVKLADDSVTDSKISASTKVVRYDGTTGSAGIPAGTTLQRSSNPSVGDTRLNTDLGRTEIWNGSVWQAPEGLYNLGLVGRNWFYNGQGGSVSSFTADVTNRVRPGDFVIVSIYGDTAAPPATLDGFTNIVGLTTSTSFVQGRMYAKVWNGTETNPIPVTMTGETNYSYTVAVFRPNSPIVSWDFHNPVWGQSASGYTVTLNNTEAVNLQDSYRMAYATLSGRTSPQIPVLTWKQNNTWSDLDGDVNMYPGKHIEKYIKSQGNPVLAFIKYRQGEEAFNHYITTTDNGQQTILASYFSFRGI